MFLRFEFRNYTLDFNVKPRKNESGDLGFETDIKLVLPPQPQNYMGCVPRKKKH